MTLQHIYAQRRARVAAQLGPDGIALIPTAPERQRNRDSDFLYRHDSYFYYLTGFAEPNAWLVITGDGRSTLLCQPKDPEREIWDGIRLGPDAAPDALGAGKGFQIQMPGVIVVFHARSVRESVHVRHFQPKTHTRLHLGLPARTAEPPAGSF